MPRPFLIPFLTALWLAGCAVAPPSETPSWDEILNLPPDQAWERIDLWPEEERALRRYDLLVEWAGLGRWDVALARLPSLDASRLDPARKDALRLLQAEALLRGGEELAALSALSSLPENETSLRLRVRVYDQLGDPENALRARLLLAARSRDDATRDALLPKAWNGLLATPRAKLEAWRDRTGDEVWRGWLELALLARADAPRGGAARAGIDDWKRRHGEHPAERWLPSVIETLERVHPELLRLAALIPVSGDFAPIGRAIRLGVEAGMRRQSGPAPELRVYDTGDPSRAVADLYRQAVEEGAQRVIGPFDKDAVAALARAGDLSVDTVSLNYLERAVEPPARLFQFGLLPEDEAVQAADRALAEGRRAAIVFAPASGWGQRLARAFAERFAAGGGIVRGQGFYFANASDHAAKIKDLLKLSEGERRKRQVEEAIGREVTSRPTRRQDVDMVFLASSAPNARLFKPQLDFYYAGDLPLYATSHVYSGVPSPLQDQDLEGALFCDIPLVLDARLRELLGDALPARDLPRIAALGADAYLLATNLDFLQTYPEATLDGWTGELSLRERRRVFRSLEWARFTDGVPRPEPRPRRDAGRPYYRTQD